MIVWGYQKKNQADWTTGKKSTPLFPKSELIFWKSEKNKIHLIKMFAKQKSCIFIDVEKRIFFQGCEMPQKKVISFLIFNIYYFKILNIHFNPKY